MVATTHVGPYPDIEFDRDFLAGAREQNQVELLRQEIAEMFRDIAIKQSEMRAIQFSLAGTVDA